MKNTKDKAPDVVSDGSGSPVSDRISEYLQLGGLFNPEMMEHGKVRDLLVACRDEITALVDEGDKVRLRFASQSNEIANLRWRVSNLREALERFTEGASFEHHSAVPPHEDTNYDIANAFRALAATAQEGKANNITGHVE